METHNLQSFGIEVIGIDMSQPQAPDTVAQLHRLWADNGLLLFRDQNLEERDVVALNADKLQNGGRPRGGGVGITLEGHVLRRLRLAAAFRVVQNASVHFVVKTGRRVDAQQVVQEKVDDAKPNGLYFGPMGKKNE